MKFLDSSGLAYYHSKIKNWINVLKNGVDQSLSSLQSSIDEEAINRQNAISSVQSALADETADRRSDTNTLSARMDTFTNLPTGSTAGDSELMDMRVPVGGGSYASAGTAVRNQVSGIYGALASFDPSVGKRNLLLTVPSWTVNGGSSKIVSASGSFADGITLTGKPTNIEVVQLTAKKSPIHLKKGKHYVFYEANQRGGSLSTFRLDLRPVLDITTVLAYENTPSGGSYSPSSDTDVMMCARIAANYNMNMTIYPVVLEYSEDISTIISNRIKGTGINMLLPVDFRENASESGISMVNNRDGSLTFSGTASTSSLIAFQIVKDMQAVYLEAGHQYTFYSNSSNGSKSSYETYRMDIRKKGSAGTVLAADNPIGGIFKCETSGLYLFFIRFASGFVANGLTLRPILRDVSLIDETVEHGFRLCAYNVGNFANGESPAASGTDEMYDKFIETFKQCKADVYAFSEWDLYWNYDERVLSSDVLGDLMPYKTNFRPFSLSDEPSRYVHQMTYSNYAFSREESAWFADGEAHYFVDDVIIIDGKPVHIITAHFPWSTQSLRHSDIDKVYKYINDNKIEYYVIAGDFNLGLDVNGGTSKTILDIAREDVDFITSKGSKSVQGGFFGKKMYDGFINTFNTPGKMKPYDNIVVSQNIRIKNVFTVESDASDHIPLCADLVIL